MAIRRSGQFVTPGERLGVIEEFVPGKGTYVVGGAIYSQVTGHALVDLENRKISVFPKTKTPVVPKKGATVFAEVIQVQEKVASVKILKINETELVKPFSAILHVSFTSPDFLRSLHDAVRSGDIIVARVLGDENQPYQLTTADNELGVIQSSCSRCGGALTYNRRTLACQRCGHFENRKVSDNYGKFN